MPSSRRPVVVVVGVHRTRGTPVEEGAGSSIPSATTTTPANTISPTVRLAADYNRRKDAAARGDGITRHSRILEDAQWDMGLDNSISNMDVDYSISIPKAINNKDDKDDEGQCTGRTRGMVLVNMVLVDMRTHHHIRVASCLRTILHPRATITRGIL